MSHNTSQKRTIRSMMGPTDQMVADLIKRSITPAAKLPFLTDRYNISEGYNTLRAFREAVCIYGQSAGTVLVLMDPECKFVIGQVEDPATDLCDEQMTDASYKLSALLTRDVREAFDQVVVVDGQERYKEYCISVMPRFDYQSDDAEATDRFAIRNFYMKPSSRGSSAWQTI